MHLKVMITRMIISEDNIVNVASKHKKVLAVESLALSQNRS